MANHQSFVDILLISQLPWEMKWLSKADFFKYPRRMADADGRRHQVDPRAATRSWLPWTCKDRLSKNVSVMIFPEGTSNDGEMKKFKDGVRLAIETGADPAVGAGWNHPALQKGDWRFCVADAEVECSSQSRRKASRSRMSVLRTAHTMIADELALMKAGWMPLLFASDDDCDLVRAERDVGAASAISISICDHRCGVQHLRAGHRGAEPHGERRAGPARVVVERAHDAVRPACVGRYGWRSLAAEAGVTAATLTGVMKTLEGRGLLRRKGDRADGRRILVSLTPRGRNVVGDVMPAFQPSRVSSPKAHRGRARRPRPLLRTILRT